MSEIATNATAALTAPPTDAPEPAAAGAAASAPPASASSATNESAEPPSVKLPGKDATPDDWKAFYKAIGAPEGADAYQLPVPDGDTGEFAKTAATWMAEAGLLPHQAELLAKKWNEHVSQMTETERAATEAARAEQERASQAKNAQEADALKREWGESHVANMEAARRAVREFLPQDKAADIVAAIESVVGYSQTMKLMHTLGKGLMTGSARGLGEGTPTPSQMSPAQKLYPNMNP